MPWGEGPHTTMDVFLRAYMHSSQHRGQLFVYLRLNGVTPPSWQFKPNG